MIAQQKGVHGVFLVGLETISGLIEVGDDIILKPHGENRQIVVDRKVEGSVHTGVIGGDQVEIGQFIVVDFTHDKGSRVSFCYGRLKFFPPINGFYPFAVADVLSHIQAETVNSFFEPELSSVEDLLVHFGVLVIQVRHFTLGSEGKICIFSIFLDSPATVDGGIGPAVIILILGVPRKGFLEQNVLVGYPCRGLF